jgi:hypothetical protein
MYRLRRRLLADDTVGDVCREEKIVGDDESSTVAGLRSEKGGELKLALRIHPSSRLVENQYVRFGDEDGGEREALALAAGEVARVAVLVALEVDRLERGPSTLEIAAHAERDLLFDSLGDDVAPWILTHIGGSA